MSVGALNIAPCADEGYVQPRLPIGFGNVQAGGKAGWRCCRFVSRRGEIRCRRRHARPLFAAHVRIRMTSKSSTTDPARGRDKTRRARSGGDGARAGWEGSGRGAGARTADGWRLGSGDARIDGGWAKVGRKSGPMTALDALSTFLGSILIARSKHSQNNPSSNACAYSTPEVFQSQLCHRSRFGTKI